MEVVVEVIVVDAVVVVVSVVVVVEAVEVLVLQWAPLTLLLVCFSRHSLYAKV